MLTPLSAKKRENAHFCFTSCSFFVEPRGKVVQLLEICPQRYQKFGLVRSFPRCSPPPPKTTVTPDYEPRRPLRPVDTQSSGAECVVRCALSQRGWDQTQQVANGA